MDSGIAGEGNDERLASELARLRDALDDLRRRPIPPDADTLRHVVTASLTEAAAPPPNLLVTAIRRLDRLDARLESIEAALGAPAELPRGSGSGTSRGRSVAAAPLPLPAPSQAVDPEAIADALARRLAGMVSPRAAAPSQAPSPAASPAPPPAPGATMDDLVRTLRPLVPEAARNVLRRAGREPSPQAVEVLQQTALTAIEEAVRAAGPPGGFRSDPWASDPRSLPPPPPLQALAPAPAPPPPPLSPPPPPIDVDELAATIASQVAAAVNAQLQAAAPAESVVRQPEPPPPAPPPPPPPPPSVDPKEVADAVIRRLAEQPPPQAVVSPLAMAPLLSAVGNVEAAVARIAEPDAEVVGAVDRLEAGVEALARALEDDRSVQADEVRRGFAELHDLLRTGSPRPLHDQPAPPWGSGGEVAPDDADLVAAGGEGLAGAAGAGYDRLAAAVAGVQRRLDGLASQLEPLGGADLAAAVPELSLQGHRLERSLNHILTALAALAEHLSEQSSTWQGRFDELGALVTAGARSEPSGDVSGDLDAIRRRIDELVNGLAADRQRFLRLGGTISGLADLLGQVSSRLDRLPPGDGGSAGPAAEQDDRAPGATASPEPADQSSPVPWYEAEPEEAAPGSPGRGSSLWDDAADEQWLRDDPWGVGPAADPEPPGDEQDGTGTGPSDADGEAPEARARDDASLSGLWAEGQAGSNGGTDRAAGGPLEDAPLEGADAADPRRRRRRNRRGNRRG